MAMLAEQGEGAGGRSRRWVGALVLAVLTALALVAAWLWGYGHSAGPLTRPVQLYLPPHGSFQAIEHQLAAEGVIRPDQRFRLLALALGVSHSLRAGEYRFLPGQTPVQVLRQVAAGRVVRREVTIPEGANLRQVAAILAREQLVAADRFLALARDPRLLKQLAVPAPSLEGYLFPDTYFFSRGQRPEEMIRVMRRRNRQVVHELLARAGKEAPSLSPHQLLTLASIVEKETAIPGERPLVARVFLNRLHRGMRLQADPTVIYGLGKDFDGDLTRQDLRAPSPYNTYLHRGLPPTPIANPGRAAIQAVLHPGKGDFLYFVARKDGSHQFSRTLVEHNRAVRRFQKR